MNSSVHSKLRNAVLTLYRLNPRIAVFALAFAAFSAFAATAGNVAHAQVVWYPQPQYYCHWGWGHRLLGYSYGIPIYDPVPLWGCW